MTIFLPGRPSDLIEKLVLLRAFDPSNMFIGLLVERENDLFEPHRFGGIASDAFKGYIEELSVCKDALRAAHEAQRTLRHDLYNLAMTETAAADEFRAVVRDFKRCDETIFTVKAKIDALLAPR